VDPNSPNLYFGRQHRGRDPGLLRYSTLRFPSTGAYKITVHGEDLSYTLEETTELVPLTVGFRNPTYFTGETPYIYFWDSTRRRSCMAWIPHASPRATVGSPTPLTPPPEAQVIFHDNQGMQSIDLWAVDSSGILPAFCDHRHRGKFTGGWS
jgi:hypothetical protein